MKKRTLVLLMIGALTTTGSATLVNAETSEDAPKETFKVGFAESTYTGDWRACKVADIEEKAKEYGYELVMTNADLDIEKQIGDVEDLIAQDCDLIVIVPVDAEAIAPAFEACKEAGIPVIDMDTEYTSGVFGEDFITTIRSDQYEQGKAAGKWVVDTYGTEDSVTVLEITGTMGQSDAQNRHNGFADYVADYDNVEVITQSGDWSATTAQNVVQNVAQTSEFDVVYSHGGDMIPGIILGLKQAGLKPTEDVGVITVDSPFQVLDSIKDGETTAAITCTPRGGDTLFSCIDSYRTGEELEETYLVPMNTITSDNVDEVYDSEGY